MEVLAVMAVGSVLVVMTLPLVLKVAISVAMTAAAFPATRERLSACYAVVML
jgi:hypothetical protein